MKPLLMPTDELAARRELLLQRAVEEHKRAALDAVERMLDGIAGCKCVDCMRNHRAICREANRRFREAAILYRNS